MDKHVCEFVPSKRGKFDVCSCGERWPCAGKDCGHFQCWEERGELPVCHFCRERLSGPHNTEEATWGSMSVRGKTRAGHYCCRDANSTTPRNEIVGRARGANSYWPEKCEHKFEGKVEHEEQLRMIELLLNKPMETEETNA